MIKAKVFGYRGFPTPSATERIEKELVNFGCELTNNDPDFIIHITGLFDDAQKFYKSCKNRPVRLYCLLDVMNKSPGFYNQTKLDYEECEIAATISNVVKSDIKKKFQTNREIQVIGFPIRDVKYKGYGIIGVPFNFVGRISDPNKRTGLIKPTLEKLGFNIDLMVFVGNESPPYGMWAKNLSDDELSEMYNSTEFTFLCSEKEGLGLSAIESAICGSRVLACTDNLAIMKELGLKDFCGIPHPVGLARLVNSMQRDRQYYSNVLDDLRPKFLSTYTVEAVTKKILNLYKDYVREHKT